eukprot:5463244-Heterocapsa_arctica.AAC.2
MSSTDANWLSAERGSRLGLAGSPSASSATRSIVPIAFFCGVTLDAGIRGVELDPGEDKDATEDNEGSA